MNRKIITICAIALSFAGCANYQSKGAIDASHDIAASRIAKEAVKIVPPAGGSDFVQRVSGSWLGIKVKPLAQEAILPPVFNSTVTLMFPGRVNLRTIAERVTKVTGIPVKLKPDVFMPISSFVGGASSTSVAVNTPNAAAASASQSSLSPSFVAPNNVSDDMELNFAETPLHDVLNQIGSRFGINYTYSEVDGIIFSRLTTRTLSIKASPGDTALSASLGKSGSASNKGGDSGGVSFTSNGQVSMNSSYSVWVGIRSVLDTIKSPVGKYFINEATGTLTITDTKEIVDVVQKYIDSENAIMTQQVAIRVEMLSVSSSDNSELGVDWNAVFTKLNGTVADWSVSMVTPSSVTSSMAGSMAAMILSPRDSANGTLGKLSGSQAMINALRGFGKISDYRTFSAVTLNRQPVPLAVTKQQSYLARTSPGSSSGLGGSTVPGLEPGLLTTGFLSNVLPTVLDNNRVLLQMSFDSSELKQMGIISTGQGISMQSIQTPEVDAVQTLLRVALKSGASLVLTGFERDSKRYTQRGLTENIGLGGSYAGESTKESIVIILTPMIMDGA